MFAAKKFLDGMIKNCDDFRSQESLRPIFNTEPAFRSAKGKGVGEGVIKKFLDGELRKCEKWEEYPKELFRVLFKGAKGALQKLF